MPNPPNTRDSSDEHAPLLHGNTIRSERVTRATIYGVLLVLFLIAFSIFSFFWERIGDMVGGLPKDPEKAAKRLLEVSP